ncbi:MAG: ribonucleotide reductase N-terminal alpha domain-containing protein, partial [Halobacteriales archaeon]
MSAPRLTANELSIPKKRTTGETLADRLTSNAYNNILPARYLRRDDDGELVETQEELFPRVARNVALAEAVYEAERRDLELTVTPDQLKPDHPRRDELAAEVFGAGTTVEDDVETTLTEHNVNKFAWETVVPEIPGEIREHVESVADAFTEQMERLSFVPNSPTLMNAGDELQQLSACFVDSPTDDLTDIHETAMEAAEVFQSGGGMGYAFWRLRPYGDAVGSTGGIASGPLTFMRTFDQMCETIAQGGTRRGAQMAIMRVSHPDVIEFIHSKNKDVSLAHSLRLNDPDDYTYTSFNEALEEARDLIDEEGRVPKHLRNAVEGHLSNFNISVGVTDGFMEALRNDEDYTFINPRTGEPHIATEHTEEMYARYELDEYVTPGEKLSIPASLIWERIVHGAWENGEPGVVYLDRINQEHSFPVESTPTGDGSKYEILATNPCGEQPLMEYEACNLGHINLSTIAAADGPDWRVWSDRHAEDHPDLAAAVDAFVEEAVDLEELDDRVE